MEILNKIYQVIQKRDQEPQEGSYTNYLLKEGNDKICKKIGEEAAETIIATKNNNKKELVYEISDLFYHLLVLMYNNKVALTDIEAELQSRHKN